MIRTALFSRTTAAMNAGLSSTVEFFHSLLRWCVLLSVALAGLLALWGYLRREPIIGWHRAMAMLAMAFCHLQLVIGLWLYSLRFKRFQYLPADQGRYWKMEHLTLMLAGIALVTLGHTLSKRTNDEMRKQWYIALSYLIALALFLVATPWPFTGMGSGRGWL